jgi:hypothetical protein
MINTIMEIAGLGLSIATLIVIAMLYKAVKGRAEK